jgi:aspartyl-tRNA(Asn)/glutamyl-tRNA(Gln) amidotransferase subunit B
MEEGSLRCDANVSVRPAGTTTLGTKAEVKNLNSFRFLQKALEFEIERQIGVVGDGGHVVQETRLWDATVSRTSAMRSKEEAHDYRYFPEPDLPPIHVEAARLAALAAELPELPEARRQRFMTEYGLPEYDAGWLTQDAETARYFEGAARQSGQPKITSNWMMGDLARALNARSVGFDRSPIDPGRLAGLVGLVTGGSINSPVARQVFETMLDSDEDAEAIVARLGLAGIDDEGALAGFVDEVLAAHPGPVAQYRGGKTQTLGFLVGQVMRRAGGKANPARVNELLRRALDRDA